MTDLTELAVRIVERARALGADEVRVTVARAESTSVSHRDGRLESFEESRELSAGVSLLVDDRFSTHATSDLRPDALDAFLERTIAATRHLEPDPNRRLPDPAETGSADVDALDLHDPAVEGIAGEQRRRAAAELEELARSLVRRAPIRSATTWWWDGRAERATATSAGFAGGWRTTLVGLGGELSLEDADGRLPEGFAAFSARHLADLPSVDEVARDLAASAERRLGAGPLASGRYPVLLDARVAGRLLGVLLPPLSGTVIHERRSCLADRLGERIGAPGLDLLDDPLLPRALGSRPFDGDCLPSRRRAVLEDGVLRTFYVDVYDGRRLGRPHTTGAPGNLVVPPGRRPPEAIARDLDRAVRIEGFLGGNSNPATGDFSFGVFGTLLERGEPVRAVSEMNVSGNLLDLLASWEEAADDPWRFGSWRVPTLLFGDVQLSGT